MSQVYWFKDGKQISKRSEHYRISRDADGTCFLHTVAASLDDDGNYTIMASNPEVSRQGQASQAIASHQAPTKDRAGNGADDGQTFVS